MRRGPSIITIIYIVIGFLVANLHGYLNGFLTNGTVFLRAAVAILLWPLVAIFGIDIHTWF